MKNILFALLLLLFLSTLACAADNSATIAVSCSIPVVPGLNAPVYSSRETADAQQPLPQKQEKTAAEFIRQKQDKVIVLADGKSVTFSVETVYLR